MVEVFLDVSCPWCHGGQITARRILDEVAADPSLPLRWGLSDFMRELLERELRRQGR